MVLFLSGLHLLHDLPGVGKTGDHANLDVYPVIGNGGFLDALIAADAAGGNGVQGSGIVVIRQTAQNSFGNTTGDAKNNTAAGTQTEGHITSLRLDLVKGNAEVLDHPGQLRSGQNHVRVLLALGEGVGPNGLHLLGGAGHNGHDKGLFAAGIGGVTVVILDDRGEHSLGRPAGRYIFFHFREFVVHEFHPGGTAGGQKRQLPAVFHPVQELRGFFHDRQVRRIAGVKHLVKAHGMERCNHLAHGVFTVGQAKGITHRHPNGRGDLGHDPGIGVTQSGVNLVHVGADGQRTGGAEYTALATADTLGLGQLLVESRRYLRLGATVGKAQNADTLDFRADPDTVAAEDALVGVPDNGGRAVVHGLQFLVVLEANLPDAHFVGQILQNALAGLDAGGAVPAVGSQ